MFLFPSHDHALDTVIDWCKKRGHAWKQDGKTKTKQIRLSNGERPRAYLLPPLPDPEFDPKFPNKARDYWLEMLRAKTDTELGAIYEIKGTIKKHY